MAVLRAGRFVVLGTAEVASKAKSSVQLGAEGEAWLIETVGKGGQPLAPFKTTLGIRKVDYLLDGVAYESKNGYIKMSSNFMKQALKDAELLKKDEVKKVVWHFWKGADKEVLDFLADHGIEWVIH